MSAALDALRRQQPQLVHDISVDDWDDAIATIIQAAPNRAADEPASPRMRKLRDAMQAELVAFHERLVVRHAAVPPTGRTMDGSQFWTVDVPLTLFPRRDRGFTRLECIVELAAPTPGGVRVVQLAPSARQRVLAAGVVGAKLELKTDAKLGISTAVPLGSTDVAAAAQIYGKGQVEGITTEVTRECVVADIVGGTGGRWRFDDPHQPLVLRAEAHALSMVIEVAPGVTQLSIAGYLEATSDFNWLQATVGAAWSELGERIRTFFSRGGPCVAYAEWPEVSVSTASSG